MRQHAQTAPGAEHADDLLVVRDLHVSYAGRGVLRRGGIDAVRGVDLSIARGETLGLVGESGSGKSTIARAIVRVQPSRRGEIWLDRGKSGQADWIDLARARRAPLRASRQIVQLLFQDPYASLDPRLTVGAIVAEPLRIFRRGTRAEIVTRTRALLDEVGLPETALHRFPHEFSGGQRQRIGIARALALDPALILCDEPVSALDVSIQGQVLNLLLDLQERRGLSYLFISHDLGVVRCMSHRVAVLEAGRVVEIADAERIYRRPEHVYTRKLLAAIPQLAR